jgi:O-6-methylguanine DNA methyltransferase
MTRHIAWITLTPPPLEPGGLLLLAGDRGILSIDFWKGPRSPARARARAEQIAAERFQAWVREGDQPRQERRIAAEASEQLRAYFKGKRSVFDVPVDLSGQGTAFEQAVWDALRAIPHGSVASYGDVAARIGRKSAGRAVGRAVGKNPVPILVPCHRVVGKQGHLTGFSSGLDFKKILLEVEGIKLSSSPSLALRRVLAEPSRERSLI